MIGAIAVFVSFYFPAVMETREMAGLEERGQSITTVAAYGARSSMENDDLEGMRQALEVVFHDQGVTYAELRAPDGSARIGMPAPGLAAERGSGTGSAFVAPVLTEDGTVLGEIYLTLSQAELRARIQAMKRSVLSVAVLIFGLGLLSLILMSRVVTRPLYTIFEAVERIADGDLSQRAVVTTTDEAGQLAASFNTMVGKLQAAQCELETVNRGLEERVEERTRRWQDEQTQRVRAEEEKYQVEQFYGQILNAIPLEVTVHDPGHRFLYVNPAAEPNPTRRTAMIGRTHEDSGAAVRIGGTAFERREQAIAQALITNRLVSVEEQIDTNAGPRHFLRAYSPMTDEEGEVSQVIGYGVDITNRRQAEEALRESEEKLQQSQKMEAIGRLAGGIAHDFNNLLTVISGHAELIMSDIPPDSEIYPELQQMRKASDRAATLTRQLLAFSRKQVLQPRLIDPNEIVEGVQKMLSRLIGEHIRLVTTLQPEVGAVQADPGQLEMVLMNLAVNARDAMPEGGALTIETEIASSGQIYRRWGFDMAAGDYAAISMHDTGVGIPEALQAKVFEPFFTTKEVGKGTGLGLATVYGVVSQSGGYTFLQSTEGVGTTVRVFLPIATEDEDPCEANDRRATAMAKGGPETVLLVEDEPLVRDLTNTVLLRAGYQVLSAPGPHEALELMDRHDQDIDLLLTDVVMPGMLGNELAGIVQERRPDIKLLYMSGYTDEALLDQGALEQGVVLLQKPFSTEQVLGVVRSVLDGEANAPIPVHA